MSQTVTFKPEVSREKVMQAFMALRKQAVKNSPAGVALDEINEEIRKARYNEDDEEFIEEPAVRKQHSARGALSEYADPSLWGKEKSAWEKALKEKQEDA